MASTDFGKQLDGYGLTTANILYRLPDHPTMLQTFLWQEYDLAPRFPNLQSFLDFWQRELDGPLHSVSVAHKRLVSPAECRLITQEFQLH